MDGISWEARCGSSGGRILALCAQLQAGGEPSRWQLRRAVEPILGDLLDTWEVLDQRNRTVRSGEARFRDRNTAIREEEPF